MMANGRIMLDGAPDDLVEKLRGKLWTKAITHSQVDDYRAAHEVISTRLVGGQTIIHVLADARPDVSFNPVSGGIEDVYFSTLAASRKAA
jgi:ABC-2 type transport system ATP-binding protein